MGLHKLEDMSYFGLLHLSPSFFTFKNNLKILLSGFCHLCPRRFLPFFKRMFFCVENFEERH